MEKTLLKIMIAESQPLIAMELERILKEVAHCQISICAGTALEACLELDNFDAVFVDAAATLEACVLQNEQIGNAGAKTVFLSSYPKMYEQLSSLQPLGVVEKPFDDYLIKDLVRTWQSTGKLPS